jgi:activator of HSP90 ATPase
MAWSKGQFTRRGAIGSGAAIGMLSLAKDALGADGPLGVRKNAFAIHQEETFKAPPQRIFEVLLDGKKFTAMTGPPATIDPEAGGAFSLFGGVIFGRNLEITPHSLIVQAWSDKNWAKGTWSVARFQLKEQGTGTLLVFDHTAIPDDAAEADSLARGWYEHYWDPLRKYAG